MATTQELISSIDATLQFLVANADSMPHDIMRRTRDEAMQLGINLLDQRIDELTTDEVWQINDLVVMLDRVGY